MDISIGSSVKLKAGVSLPEWDYSFSGWQGRVISMHPEQGIFELELDGPTLESLADDYLLKCIEDNADPLNMYFREEDLELSEFRDTIRELESCQEKTIDRMKNLDPFGEWEEDYDMQMNRWYRNFERSTMFVEMPDSQQKQSSRIVHSFGNCMWEYFGVAPGHWEEEDVEACLLNEVPEKVTASVTVFENYGDVLLVFFKFLRHRKYLPTLLLQDTIEEVMQEIPVLAADRSRWSLAKEFAMSGMDGAETEESKKSPGEKSEGAE